MLSSTSGNKINIPKGVLKDKGDHASAILIKISPGMAV